MPDDFWNLVTLLRKIELGLGDGIKRPQSIEADVRQVARKSLVYRRALPKGHQIKAEDITAKRPGTGLAPASFDRVIGQSLGLSVERDQLVQERDFG
jgi:sialic acid synthase SpsE